MSMDSDRITRHFISIENNRQIHYRKAGKGPPVLLLHQSPKSSKEHLNNPLDAGFDFMTTTTHKSMRGS